MQFKQGKVTLRRMNTNIFLLDYSSGANTLTLESKTRVYGKWPTSDSRLRFFKINNKYTKIVQNNSCVYGKHETAYLP